MTDTYIIDAAHGTDDVDVHDWNNDLDPTDAGHVAAGIMYGWDPARATLKLCAPGWLSPSETPRCMDTSTARLGLMFRGITVPGDHVVGSAKLRLYLTDWDPPGTVDAHPSLTVPWQAQPTYFAVAYGMKRFRPCPYFSGAPWPDPPPAWGPNAARSLKAQVVTNGDYAQRGGFNAGDNDYWYPGLVDYPVGQGSTNIITDANAYCEIARGPEGYVEWDVTEIVREIMAHNYAAPAFVPGTRYNTGGLSQVQMADGSIRSLGFGVDTIPNPATATPANTPAHLLYQGSDAVMSGGNLYVAWTFGSTTPHGIPGVTPNPGNAICTNPPTGTTPNVTEWPDGPNGIGWRFVQSGNTVNRWQSGMGFAFVVAARPPRWDRYNTDFSYIPNGGDIPSWTASRKWDFGGMPIPGWRTFASGDANDAAKAPQLVIDTVEAGVADATNATSVGWTTNALALDRPSLLTRNLSLGRDARLYGGLAAILADSTFGVSTSFQPSATAQHVGSTAFHSVLGMTLDAAQGIVGANVTLGAAILLAADAVSAQIGQSVYAQIIASSQDASYAPPGVSTGDVTVPHFLNMTLDAIQREVGNVTLGEALAVGMDADYEPVGHAHAREITLCGFYADAAFFHRIPLPGHGHYTPGRGGRQYSRQRGGADYTQRGDEKGYGEGE